MSGNRQRLKNKSTLAVFRYNSAIPNMEGGKRIIDKEYSAVQMKGDIVLNNIENTIIGILIDDLFISIPRSDIEININMRDGLGLDSLGFSELRAQCEYVFNIKIEDEYFTPQYFDSIKTLANLISDLIPNANAGGKSQ